MKGAVRVSGVLVVAAAVWIVAEAAHARSSVVDAARGAPAVSPTLISGAQQRSAGPLPLFLNFDGPQLTLGNTPDSTHNVTAYAELALDYAPYGDMTRRAAVLQAVTAHWAAYNVTVTDLRPTEGPYVMAVVSPTNPVGADAAAGLAPVDCDDYWVNDIVWAFHGGDDTYSVAEQARTIGQEIAHSFGLEHSTRPEEIMSWEYGPTEYSFIDECFDLLVVPDVEEECPLQHQLHCPPGQQNSHAELLARLHPAGYVPQPPTVEIIHPQDGDEFPIGEDFAIEVEVTGDSDLVEARVFVDGEMLGSDADLPLAWVVQSPPPGAYQIYVEAEDVDGNVGLSEVVDFSVGSSPDDADEGDDTDGDADEDEDEDEDAEDDDGLGGGIPADFPDASRPDGCSCTAHDRTDAPVVCLLLVLLTATRRRRRTAMTPES